jgi:hypothetical protein
MKILLAYLKMFNVMDKSKELPGKETPKIEDPKTKKSTPPAPVETPDPPQVMYPSAPVESEKGESSKSPNERKRKPSKTKHTA